MKQLKFGKKEYESIKQATSLLKEENGDPDQLYTDEFLKAQKGKESMYFHNLGWLNYDFQDLGYDKVLFFEYNTTKYFGSLQFIYNTKDDKYSVFDNECYKEFNEDLKDEIEWLIQNFSGTKWTLECEPVESDEPEAEESEPEVINKPEAKPTIKPIIEKLESLFSTLNNVYFDGELETPVITIAPDNCRAYGWFTTWRAWKDTQDKDSDGYYEINITSDYLSRDSVETAGTLLHEMVHLYNKQKGIKDCTRSGHYHNAKFRDAALAHGLDVEKDSKNGFCRTKPNAETVDFLKSLDLKFDLYRPTPEEGQKIIKKSSTIKYVCPECGAIIRSTKPVRVICAECDVEFEQA